MKKTGLTPTYYIITLLGYIVITCAYAIFLKHNLKQKKYGIIFGSALITYGYALLVYEYYVEWNVVLREEKRLNIVNTHEKGLNIEEAEQKAFQQIELDLVAKHFFTGHLILFIFHALSFIMPITAHLKMSDITAVFGHLMVYTNFYLTFGYALLLVYYILYFIRNFEEAHEFFVNKLQVVGSGMLIYHYLQNIMFMLSM